MSDRELAAELGAVRAELARLNGHAFVRRENSTMRVLGFNFARGLAFGLGTVFGASLLVSFLAYSLREIDFIPVIGDWAAEIAVRIEQANAP